MNVRYNSFKSTLNILVLTVILHFLAICICRCGKSPCLCSHPSILQHVAPQPSNTSNQRLPLSFLDVNTFHWPPGMVSWPYASLHHCSVPIFSSHFPPLLPPSTRGSSLASPIIIWEWADSASYNGGRDKDYFHRRKVCNEENRIAGRMRGNGRDRKNECKKMRMWKSGKNSERKKGGPSRERRDDSRNWKRLNLSSLRMSSVIPKLKQRCHRGENYT